MNDLFYANLLEKYMRNINYHEARTYTSDLKLEDSNIDFTEREIIVLQEISNKLNYEQS